MKRRSFLRQSSLAAGALALPAVVNYFRASGKTGTHPRRLVMIRLKGGNDGFNTLTPFQDDLYYRNRPSLALQKDELISLGNGYGLNASMKSLLGLYSRDKLLFINSVGFDAPEPSHYHAMRIWHTGYSRPEEEKSWLSRCNSTRPPAAQLTFLNADTGMLSFGPVPEEEYLACTATDFDAGLQKVAASIISGSPVSVFHIALDGFDTHQMQKYRQNNLLETYSSAAVKLAGNLEKAGYLENTLILTYSEFGRTIAENNRRGTDHGNSNCLWIAGGGLKCTGLYSDDASFSPAVTAVCRYHCRDILATILDKWFRINPHTVFDEKFTVMNWI